MFCVFRCIDFSPKPRAAYAPSAELSDVGKFDNRSTYQSINVSLSQLINQAINPSNNLCVTTKVEKGKKDQDLCARYGVYICTYLLDPTRRMPHAALSEFYIELEFIGTDADWTDSRKATFEAAARR